MSRYPTIRDARDIAKRLESDDVIILARVAGRIGGASYGQTKAQCRVAGRLLDEIINSIQDGAIGADEGDHMTAHVTPRYEWRDGQLWDLERACWVIWRTVSGELGIANGLADRILELLNRGTP